MVPPHTDTIPPNQAAVRAFTGKGVMKADEKPRFHTLDGKPLFHFMGTSTFSGWRPTLFALFALGFVCFGGVVSEFARFGVWWVAEPPAADPIPLSRMRMGLHHSGG